ncbi:MAG TPA: hypothetical protein VFN68_09100 [Acidimicrobiales bacterium]|nr:hypothetical protein [Acidimicrobiales bacterium]
MFGLSTNTALVILFVLLPFVLAAVIFPLVQWRHSGGPRPVRTSEILSGGLPGRAQILSVQPLGSVLDARPMVRFRLMVSSGARPEPFELEVVQSFPRAAARRFRPGESVDVRLTPDLSQGAVVWSDLPT